MKVVTMDNKPLPLDDFNQPDQVRDAQAILSSLEDLRALFLKDAAPLANMRFTDSNGRVMGYSYWSDRCKRIIEAIDSHVKGVRK